MEIKFAATSRPGTPQDTIEWVRAAEGLGYHRIGIADSPALYRETWVSATLVALNTRRVPFGPWVTNPVSRHPVVTASAAATIDDLAPGRVSIGIGSGNSGVYNLGRRASPLAVLREYVLAVRALLQEGKASYRGGTARLPWARRSIPIYMAALAQGSLRLAGEVADGVVLGTGTSPKVVEASLEILAQGARAAGRDPDDIDVWWSIPFDLRDESEGALDPQGGAAREANYLARFTLEGKFIPDEHKEGIRRLAQAYDLTTHGRPTLEQLESYDGLAREYGVKEYLEGRFGGISGTADECVERVRELAKLGVNQFSINLPDTDRPGRLKRIMEQVIGRV